MLSPLQLSTPPDAKGVPLADWQAAEWNRIFGRDSKKPTWAMTKKERDGK